MPLPFLYLFCLPIFSEETIKTLIPLNRFIKNHISNNNRYSTLYQQISLHLKQEIEAGLRKMSLSSWNYLISSKDSKFKLQMLEKWSKRQTGNLHSTAGTWVCCVWYVFSFWMWVSVYRNGRTRGHGPGFLGFPAAQIQIPTWVPSAAAEKAARYFWQHSHFSCRGPPLAMSPQISHLCSPICLLWLLL